jgi:diketogulonate reductase-like aldo/keto reductase
MIARSFGWTGVDVPVIGQGTWMIENARARAVQALRLGLELGLRHIDTAEMYGSGQAEEIVAEAIEGRRAEVFLVSKVLPSNASYEGTLRACERSLRRLRTDYLDLYLLHWESSHPIRETMRAMETLIAQKAIRFAGVSNFDVPQLRAAEAAMRHERVACNQVLYHLSDRGIERKLIPYCAERGIAVVGYSPFGHRGFRTNAALERVAARHKATPRQVVLNFLTRNAIVFTIPKASQTEHVRQNATALDFTLTPEDAAEIDQAFPAPDRDVTLGMI